MFSWLKRLFAKNHPEWKVMLGVAVGREMKDEEAESGYLTATACNCDDPNCPDFGVVIEFVVLAKEVYLPFVPQTGMMLIGYGEGMYSIQQVVNVCWDSYQQVFSVKLDNHFVDEDPIRSKVLLEGVLDRYTKNGWKRCLDKEIIKQYK